MTDNLPATVSQRLMVGKDVFATPDDFAHAQRVANIFAHSTMVPKHLQNNLPDCLIAYQIARRLNEEPMTVMQNIYIVGGRPGWKTEYVIARAYRSGVFKGRITWTSEGEGEKLAVTAHARLADTGEEIEATVNMAMAKAEGWTKNTKYQSMPLHMLRWRSAAMLIRLFAPEVMLGIPTVEEVETLAPERDVTPRKPNPNVKTLTPEAVAASQQAYIAQRSVDGMLDKILLPNGDRMDTETGEITEEAGKEVVDDGPDKERRFYREKEPTNGSDPGPIPESLRRKTPHQEAVEAEYERILTLEPPANAEEYEGFLVNMAMLATTDPEKAAVKKDAVRLYWKQTFNTRTGFGMTSERVATLGVEIHEIMNGEQVPKQEVVADAV